MQSFKRIFLVGPMGAGKSSIGRHVARALGLSFYDSDSVIEERCGADIPWIFDVEGEEGFRKREKAVIDELTRIDNVLISTGGGTITQAENRAALSERGFVVYLQVSLEDQIVRTANDANRPLLLNVEDRVATLKKLKALRDPLYASIADATFCTDQRSPQSVAKDIVRELELMSSD